MTKIFCDRCGKEIQNSIGYRVGLKRYYKQILFFSRNRAERLEETEHVICPDCQENLWDWWNKGKE